MPLWTSYLAFWTNNHLEIFEKLKATDPQHGVKPLFVARNRGNNAVAPSADLLYAVKHGQTDWNGYEQGYLAQLESDAAYEWMEDVLPDLEDGLHVILICFEKDASHCHRRLLAEKMKREFPNEVDYRGEISLP